MKVQPPFVHSRQDNMFVFSKSEKVTDSKIKTIKKILQVITVYKKGSIEGLKKITLMFSLHTFLHIDFRQYQYTPL